MASVGGTCLDVAGNAAAPSLLLKYDATAPQASATASRPADFGGWFNHALTVNFAATDATSGPASCPAPKSYSGPDDAAASVGGTCLDVAGNAATPSLTLKYDATAPQATATPTRPANANGWYNAPVPVGFAGTDATAGLASCEAQKTYSGPDSALAAVVGSCQDQAGNTGAASFGLKYDATVPQTTATPSRQPNAKGWFNAAMSVGFSATDALSGVDSCAAAKNYAGPDVASVVLSGSCLDKAGNSQPAAYTVKYDATNPVATATASRPPNANGWYRAPLDVSFAATDLMSGFESCDGVKSYAGPDTASTAVGGACRDNAGNSATASVQLKYDATDPVATAAASRQPNALGWYRTPLTSASRARTRCRGPLPAPRPRVTAGRTTRRLSSAEPAWTEREMTALRRWRSSTTRPAHRRPSRLRGSPTRTAGSTLH